MQSSKDVKKFWSFKDTKHYKRANYDELCKIDVYRKFIFTKSFLVEIYKKEEDKNYYVIPLEFSSHNFPSGSYLGLTASSRKLAFVDEEIVKVF
jgi:hypothetical protein